MVVFRGAKREVAALNQEFKQQAVVATSANAWMDTGLTEVWIDSVLGSFSFNRRLLAWDSFECHIEESIHYSRIAVQKNLSSNCARRVHQVCPGTGRLLEQAFQGRLH